MTQDRGTLTGTASALDTEDSFIRKYSARHASGKAAIAIQAAPSGQIKSLLYRRPGSTRTPGVYINISSALLLDIARVASTTQFFASCASWSGHGHSAWLLPRASPVASTYAPSRAPVSFHVSHYPRGPPGKYRNTPRTNHRKFIFVPVRSSYTTFTVLRHALPLSKSTSKIIHNQSAYD